jgi:hypothetical protein
MKIDLALIKDIKDRFTKQELAIAGSLVFLLVLVIVLLGARAGAAGSLASARASEKEFKSLLTQYVSLKGGMDVLRRRAALGPKEGIIKSIDDVFSSMGLKDRLSTVKPTGTAQLGDLIQEQAEVSIKNVDLNEAVNILYKIENAPALLMVKDADIKTSFSAPKLDMVLRLALARKK